MLSQVNSFLKTTENSVEDAPTRRYKVEILTKEKHWIDLSEDLAPVLWTQRAMGNLIISKWDTIRNCKVNR